MQRGEEYDYNNIVFAQTDANITGIALDRGGVLIASAVDTAIRVKDATEAARQLTRRMAAVTPRRLTARSPTQNLRAVGHRSRSGTMGAQV